MEKKAKEGPPEQVLPPTDGSLPLPEPVGCRAREAATMVCPPGRRPFLIVVTTLLRVDSFIPTSQMGKLRPVGELTASGFMAHKCCR